MKPKFLLGFALVLGGGLFGVGCRSVGTHQFEAFAWPDREIQGPAWPKPRASARIIDERYAQASTNVLGSETDITAIHQVIMDDRPNLNLRVEELRWLSPSQAMARVRAPEAEYFYVVEKRDGRWRVLTYYLKWIS